MKSSKTDIFEVSKEQQYISSKPDLIQDSSNFFLSNDVPNLKLSKRAGVESSRRLNDYDFNLLKEDAYKDVTDDVFKLEYKISRTEDEIKNLNLQIQAAMDIKDYNFVNELVERKKVLEEDLEALIALYNDKSLSARLTDGITNLFGSKFKNKFEGMKDKLSSFTEAVMLKLPGQFSSIVELKRSLNKLEVINKSVDELMAMNLPYGENINKYDQLSKFIIKANSIQSEINHYIRGKSNL